ncbi:sulfite exporter TauE/SafE family protein [Rhodocaloribacter sp.]
MPEYADIFLLFGVGLVAGVLNVMAGGGSTLTVPVLLFLGLDGATANGTNRVAIFVQNIFAVLSFRREKVSRLEQSLIFAVWALPGAVLGAVAAVRISDEWFERILAVIMIGVVVSMIIPRSRDKVTTNAGVKTWWIYPALFGIGFYGGFIQVGVGFLFMAAFYHLLRMNLVYVNMHKVTVVLLYTVPALAIFAWTGHVDWGLGLSLAAGNALGAWWAARLAVRRGEKVIRIVLVAAILLMAAKLLSDSL